MMNRVEMNEAMMAQVNGCGFTEDMKTVYEETKNDPGIWGDAVKELVTNPVDSVKGAWKRFKSWF